MRIRLTRVGATKRPSYRVVAIDSRRPRDGRALEILGFYDPLTDPATVQLDTARVEAWIGKGAKPSDTVMKLMKQASGGAPKAGDEKPAAKSPARTRSKKAAAPTATAEPEATAEAATAEAEE